MAEPRWLTFEEVLAFHALAIERFGGLDGLRDEGLLRSALDRPRNLFHYEHAPLHVLAAAYAEGIVKNHPFADGNKRTGLTCLGIFLERNAYDLVAPTPEVVAAMLKLAEGSFNRDDVARWVLANLKPHRKRPVAPSG